MSISVPSNYEYIEGKTAEGYLQLTVNTLNSYCFPNEIISANRTEAAFALIEQKLVQNEAAGIRYNYVVVSQEEVQLHYNPNPRGVRAQQGAPADPTSPRLE